MAKRKTRTRRSPDPAKAPEKAAEDGSAGQLPARPRPARRRWGRLLLRTLIPFVVLAGAIGAFLALAKTRPELSPQPVSEKAWPVMVADIAISDHQPELKLYGQTVAGRRVDLRALVTGEVVETGSDFREGGIIEKGDLVLRIDPFEYETRLAEARANLREAQAKLEETQARIALETRQIEAAGDQLKLSRRDLERALELRKQGLVAQKTVDDKQIIVRDREQALAQRRSGLEIERAKADQQRAIVARLEAAQRRAERALADTRLSAPFDAYISGVNAELGQMLGVNDRVATLIDRNRIDVKFNISDAQYGRLLATEEGAAGRAVRVVWRVGETELAYDGHIERVAAEISAASGGVDVYARIEPKDGQAAIRPGAFVEVFVSDRLYRGVVRLPETSLYGGDTVYVVRDSRLQPRKVAVIGHTGRDVLVRGEIEPGDKVITTRMSEAADGVLVDVQ